MLWLASIAMRGRGFAVAVTTLLSAFSIILPPLGVIASAVVALVTLRQGLREGLLLMLFTAVACVVPMVAALGDLAPVLAFLVLLWLPAWLLGGVLRNYRSLPLAFAVALLFGVAVILVFYVRYPDPVGEWRNTLGSFAESLIEAKLLETGQRELLVETMAPWMTGILGSIHYLQLMLAVLLARWWQACLYNPGGFREEFYGLRLHRALAYGALPLVALALISGTGSWLVNCATLLLMSAFVFQGLAVTHGVVAKAGLHNGWLVGIYIVLVLAMPQTFVVLTVLGLADGWIDFRARIRPRGGAA